MISKSIALTTIASIVFILIWSSLPVNSFGVPPDPGYRHPKANCDTVYGTAYIKCCWDTKPVGGVMYCQECKSTGNPKEPTEMECKEKELQMTLELPPTPPKPSGPASPLQDDGVLEQSSSPSNSDNQGQKDESDEKENSLRANSPTPPECPKQGPIPPNCTIKPY